MYSSSSVSSGVYSGRIGLPETVVKLGEDGWPQLAGTKTEHAKQGKQQEILNFLQEQHSPVSFDKINAAVSGKQAEIRKMLHALANADAVQITKDGKKHLYAVTPIEF